MGAGMTWVCCVTGAQAASYPAPITSCRVGEKLAVYVRRPSMGILSHNRGDGPVFLERAPTGGRLSMLRRVRLW